MSKEQNYQSLYRKYQALDTNQLKAEVLDLEQEMFDGTADRTSSPNFATLNESSNNLKRSVL